MKCIELFIPLFNKNGKAFAKKKYKWLRVLLTDKFGGLTIYARAPAEGFWQEKAERTVNDKMIIYEVLVPAIDKVFWQELKLNLLKKFAQDEILIRVTDISLL